jgi:hypothetical protein
VIDIPKLGIRKGELATHASLPTRGNGLPRRNESSEPFRRSRLESLQRCSKAPGARPALGLIAQDDRYLRLHTIGKPAVWTCCSEPQLRYARSCRTARGL